MALDEVGNINDFNSLSEKQKWGCKFVPAKDSIHKWKFETGTWGEFHTSDERAALIYANVFVEMSHLE